MARWTPPAEVGKNEQIGRRLFDEPMLIGAKDQPSWNGIRMNHFEETRGTEISMDRLGATGVDRKVLNYLLPRAVAGASNFSKPKTFHGWISVAAKEVVTARKGLSFAVASSPVEKPEPDDNIYHAHVVRPEDTDAMLAALYLREIFTNYGKVEVAPDNERSKPVTVFERLKRHPLWQALLKLLNRSMA